MTLANFNESGTTPDRLNIYVNGLDRPKSIYAATIKRLFGNGNRKE